jgi:hypothetical protein
MKKIDVGVLALQRDFKGILKYFKRLTYRIWWGSSYHKKYLIYRE